MFRPWLRVAVPDDWTGSLTRLASALVAFLVLLGPLIGRLPTQWVFLAGGQGWLVRIVLLLVSAWVVMQLRPLAYVPLPRTIVLLGRRLRLPGSLTGRWLKIGEIDRIHVDERPDGEVFTLAMLDGLELELCPVGWRGAGRLYTSLARRVARARKRRFRAASKAPSASGQAKGVKLGKSSDARRSKAAP